MTDTPDLKSKCLRNNNSDNKDDVGCPWYINSPKHNNCLWVFIKESSGPDGSMKELVQTEIAQLLGWSNTKTHFMLKQAMAELIEALQKFRANQLLTSDPDHIIDINSFSIDPIVNYSTEDSEE
jgi:hypothetical protein